MLSSELERQMSGVSVSTEGGQDCQICHDSSDGLHFGVFTCRACAAFFRRTVSLKLEYQCRHSGHCPIEKTARNMCRSCRFQKCLDVGMLTSAVQQARDGIGKRKEQPKQRVDRPIVKKTLFEPPTPSPSEGWMDHQPIHPLPSRTPPINSSFAQLDINPSSAFSVVREQMRLLPKMHEGYLHFLSIRKATHSLVENENLSQMFQKNEHLRMSNFDSSKKVCQMEAHLVTEIVNNYFPPFISLPFTEKVILFKNFFCYLSHTDRAYQSFRLFGHDPNDDRILMPDGGYIKCSELEKFYENAENVKASPQEAANIFRPAMLYILNVIVGHMRRIQLTDYEYITILGLFLWNESANGILPETVHMIHETQDILFHDLHIHYKNMGLSDGQITARTGQLMLLLPKLTRSVVMFKENFELAELFNIFEADVCCKSFKTDLS